MRSLVALAFVVALALGAPWGSAVEPGILAAPTLQQPGGGSGPNDDSDSPEEDKSDDAAAKDAAESDEEKKEEEKSEDSASADEKPAEDKKDEEAKSDDGKEADKPADDKAAEEKKPADDKKAEPKKPETHKVEAKKLKIEVEVEGVFVAKEAEEVALRPEVWASFKVLEAVPHGKRVRKGDVLVKFDEKEIDQALAEKSLEQRVGELTLMAAEEEFPRLEKSIELNYEQAERDHEQAVDEYDRFQTTMRSMSEKMAEYYLSSAQQDLDNAREELTQLEKMYEADELTEETEEIVLRRQKFQVKAAEFFMEYSKINHDYTMNVSIPLREKSLSTAVEQAEIGFERAKMAKSLGLNKERYELQALREGRERSVESHSKLVADRALMTLKAPADGVAYFGRCVNGRWVEVSSLEQKLIPFGLVTPNSVVYTIVKERPMHVETSIGEKELPTVKKDQPVTLVPLADEEVELTGKVEEVANVPGGGNKFAVKVKLDSDEAPEWLMPGMGAKAKIKTYEAKEAVVIPADLVQSDEDDAKKKYVMVQVEGEEKPVRREIKLGKKKDKEVEVVKGLEAGDQIVKGAKDKPEDEEAKDDKAEEKKD
jgi:multidrug resistance efflux pump